MKAYFVRGASTAAIALAAAVPGFAQDVTPATASPSSQTASPEDTQTDAGSDRSQIEDIVVTGRKRARSEAIQDTPLSITAFGESTLRSPVTVNLVDIGRLTPNASLQSSSQRGVQNFSIRGMGISGTTPSDEPAVGVFQDGVYWGSNYGALGDLFDLEGVEVLRGPQGTLFGRNVTGGAITVRSARPTNERTARVSMGIGNYDMVEASAIVNQPLVDDTLAARVALQARTYDGYFTNTNNNDDYGGTSSYIVRPSIKWTPSSAFNITLIGEYFTEYGDPTVVRGVAPNTIPGGPLTLPEREGYRTPADYYSVSPDTPGFSDVEVWFGAVEANLTIGPGVLTSVSGVRRVHAQVLTDFDGTPSRGFLQGINNRQHQFSSELRYAADVTDWLGFTAGVYYFKQKFDFQESRRLNNDLSLLATQSKLTNESYAAFAEADVKITPDLTLTAGARYTEETKDALAAPFGACTIDFARCTFGTSQHYSANNFSPKVGVSYDFGSALVFASATRGFRSGGFSLRGTVLIEPYKEETVKAYEAGFKTDFLDRRLRLNGSLYYNEYKDLQRTVLGVSATQGVIQAVFNAADATIKGGELELIAIPVTGLTLNANYGYTDAGYESFAGVTDPKSRQFVRVPKHTLNVGAEYAAELANGDSFSGRVSASYSSRYFYDDPNLLSQKGYTLVDATVSYKFSPALSFTVYGKNLTKVEYATWGSTLGALGQNLFPAAPRTFGARLTADF